VRVNVERQERPLRLPVVGAANAPNSSLLKQQGAVVVAATADPESAVRLGDEDVVLRIGEDFGADWQAGRPATVEVIADPSRQPARVAVERTRRLLATTQPGRRRPAPVGARGQRASQALAIAEVDVSTPQSQALFINILPYFRSSQCSSAGLSTSPPASASGAASETCSATPCRWQITGGKMGATHVFTVVAPVVETVLASR
jgi:sodium transport system permease protein